ncbi:MAG: hypothetical protein ACREGC_02610, partial [Minisyncoccia bacterium]
IHMRKARILLVLGIWIAILPYLGFPYSWKNVLTVLSGLVLIYMSYRVYKEYKLAEDVEQVFDNFSENSDFIKNETVQEEETEIKLNQDL